MKNQSALEMRYGSNSAVARVLGGGGGASSVRSSSQSSQRPSSAQISPRDSRSSSINAQARIKPRSNTPGIGGSSSSSSSVGGGVSPLTSKASSSAANRAVLEDFAKPTAAAERRNQSASVLAERLRNIVSKHDERVPPVSQSAAAMKQHASATGSVSRQQQQQQQILEDQHYQRQLGAAAAAAAGTAGGNDKAVAMRMLDRSTRVMIGGDGTVSAPRTPREEERRAVAPIDLSNPDTWNGGLCSAEGTPVRPVDVASARQQLSARTAASAAAASSSSAFKGYQRGGDDDEDSSSSPDRTPLIKPQHRATMHGIGATPPRALPGQVVPGFSWCADWTRRGMRPPEVAFNEQNRVALDATTHVEPRNIDTWTAVQKVGSFLCRRCGLPVFPASSLVHVPRAGHLTFAERFARCTEPDLCPQSGSVIIRCTRCAAFLADIYDVQSRSLPPLIRASSWCLWYAPGVVVPGEYAATLGPYIDDSEDDDGDGGNSDDDDDGAPSSTLGKIIKNADELF